jgi:probable DNA metabolism protein
MTAVIYDGSYQGLLTAIFEIYEYRTPAPSISKDEATYSLFGNRHVVRTDMEKAKRVLSKLEQKLSPTALTQFYKTFLSEIIGIENHMLRYVQYILSSKQGVENDYSHPDVLLLQQTSRKVDREKHRMEAFVRFQLTKDKLYYSLIQPDFNVLPLISKHFKDRYADQRWMIYDTIRKYGLYYDLKDVSEVQMEFSPDLNNKDQLALIHDEKENLYQALWQQYFSSVNIKARKNMKLHIRHMPKRYWRNLVEKQKDVTDW